MDGAKEVLEQLDGMVLEYLLYRGFLSTFNEMVSERTKDRLESMSSEKVARQLLEATLSEP